MIKPRGRIVKSFSYGPKEQPVIIAAEEIAQRERAPFSRIVIAALDEFVEKHGKGNPQKPLFQGGAVSSHKNPVTKQRRDNLETVYSTLKCMDPMSLSQAEAHFSKVLGVKRSTVKDYIRVLATLGQIRFIHNKMIAV